MSILQSSVRAPSAAKGNLLEAKLVAYAAAAGTLIVGAQAAHAVPTVLDDPIRVFDGSESIDIDGDGVDDFTFTHSLGTGPGDPSEAGVAGTNLENQVVGYKEYFVTVPLFYADRFDDPIIPSPNRDDFYSDAKLADSEGAGAWEGATGYLGIKFLSGAGLATGNIHLAVGPASVPAPSLTDGGVGAQQTDLGPVEIEILGWDFQLAPVAAVPEPVGLGALALGAAGVAAMRRRRRA